MADAQAQLSAAERIEERVVAALARVCEVYDIQLDDSAGGSGNLDNFINLVEQIRAAVQENPPGTVVLLRCENSIVYYAFVVPPDEEEVWSR